MVWIKLEEENMIVTKYYLQVIGCAFKRLNQNVSYYSDLKDITPKKGDIVVISTAPSVWHFMNRNVKVVYWAQGAWPEESYMRHASKIRFLLTGFIEKMALKRADFLFFVSKPMRKHFIDKYNISTLNNFYIMPCSNESFHIEAFKDNDKYNNNYFCYVGGTSVWQCFEETIELYAKIESTISNSKLLLLVKNREYALELLKKYNVKNYEIDYVSVEDLPAKLRDIKYGFILRKKSKVNEVATPTKTLTYIANGIIPIYSNSLNGIQEVLKDCKYKIEISDEENRDVLSSYIDMPIDKLEIMKEYRRVYDESYNEENHIPQIAKKFLEARIINKK